MLKGLVFLGAIALSLAGWSSPSYSESCHSYASHYSRGKYPNLPNGSAPKYRPARAYGRDRISREERRYQRKLERWAKRYHYHGASIDSLDRIHRTHYERIDRYTNGAGHCPSHH